MKKTIKNLMTILISVLMMVTFVSCSKDNTDKVDGNENAQAQTGYPYKFTDSMGNEVVIESEPKRIISVAPSITETIYALGKEGNLVGRTDYCDYPEEAKNVESIGSLTNPDVEKIVELKPDVVIASTHFKEDVGQKLKDLGINIVVLNDSENVNGAYESINKLGEILNAKDKAQEVVNANKEKIEEIKEKTAKEEAPTAYYVVGFGKNGDFTATGDTFIAEMIELAGGKNIAQDATGWKYNLESLIENDPEYIIISNGMKDEFMATEGYKELSAVKNNNVFEIDNNLLNRQGPRISEGVEALAKILHPNLFK